jgi:hypothetical protein
MEVRRDRKTGWRRGSMALPCVLALFNSHNCSDAHVRNDAILLNAVVNLGTVLYCAAEAYILLTQLTYKLC